MIIQATNDLQLMMDLISDGPLAEFLTFAKEYNIFQVSNSKFYDMTCDKIRQRLTKEGLTEDALKQ